MATLSVAELEGSANNVLPEHANSILSVVVVGKGVVGRIQFDADVVVFVVEGLSV